MVVVRQALQPTRLPGGGNVGFQLSASGPASPAAAAHRPPPRLLFAAAATTGRPWTRWIGRPGAGGVQEVAPKAHRGDLDPRAQEIVSIGI
jgi:hypothetical protein